MIIILSLSLCFPVYGEDLDGKACLQKGRSELDKGKYNDAIVSLTKAEREFPLLGDYALFWLADAYRQTGDHKQSLATIRTLLNKYPKSPLVKKSRSGEVQAVLKLQEENPQSLYEAYLKDYPEDREMKYYFAQWLTQSGQTEKAKTIFKDIYRDAQAFSMMASRELKETDIGVGDMLQHASNHNKQMNYKTAESVLRSALAKDEGRLKTDILRELGLSMFRQKKYLEAADIYKQSGDKYWEFRSLYRSGAKETLDKSLNELLSFSDKRMGSILISMAADRRREGKGKDAVTLYQTVMEKFPSEAEEALWGIGWTHFLAGEYMKASEIFSRLYSAYGSRKYLYWRTRSLELRGEGGAVEYPATLSGGTDFYSIMLKVRAPGGRQQAGFTGNKLIVRNTKAVQATYSSSPAIERIEYLFYLGLRSEALSEMMHVSRNTGSPDDLLYLCLKFEEMEEYKSSVRLAGRVPGADMVQQFLYPLAYRDLIESFSEKYALDPFLVLAVIREESRFDYEARSPAGAIGLMQLMPGTAFRLNRELNVGVIRSGDLTDIKKNLHLGIYYLSALIREFGAYPEAIAAYNAGEETVRKWLQRGKYSSVDEFIEDIPYNETRNYVKRVLTSFFEYRRRYLNDRDMAGVTPGSM